jgi:uncharacterized protein (DUF433 family)
MEHQGREADVRPPAAGLHIVTKPGHCSGKPHIDGHRIKVSHVVLWHERFGKSPDEIVAEHPGLTLADVYAALVYYHDHRQEIDADIESDNHFVTGLQGQGTMSRLMQRITSGHAPSDPVSPR